MLQMTDVGLYTFDAKAGRQLYEALDKLGMDDEKKRRFIASLYGKLQIGKVLLQPCGIERCWYDRRTRPTPPSRSRKTSVRPRTPVLFWCEDGA